MGLCRMAFSGNSVRKPLPSFLFGCPTRNDILEEAPEKAIEVVLLNDCIGTEKPPDTASCPPRRNFCPRYSWDILVVSAWRQLSPFLSLIPRKVGGLRQRWTFHGLGPTTNAKHFLTTKDARTAAEAPGRPGIILRRDIENDEGIRTFGRKLKQNRPTPN